MTTSIERDGTPPAAILEKLKATDPEFAKSIQPREVELTMPPVIPLGALVRHPSGNDPQELIRHRYLCRGGSVVFVGPTGVGKSSFSMQLAICFSIGQPCFGLTPARPLRVLIVQAENDSGDMAEMRDGVIAGMKLSGPEQELAATRVAVVSEDSKTRETFASMLDTLLAQNPADLVIADPAFAYIGGDASSQRDVSPFLRNMLNPVIHKHNVGFMLVHHVNKPPQGEQKSTWQAGDFAYLGSGSAEFANWARAVIAIRSIGSDSVFELMLAKRGRRAGWTDQAGLPTTKRFIAYDREPGVICWRDAEPQEVAPFRPIVTGATIQNVVDLVFDGSNKKADVVARLMASHGIKKTAAYDLITAAARAGVIEEGGPKNRTTLAVTEKATPAPPTPTPPEDEKAA